VKELLWTYHIQMKDLLCEELLWEYHIPIKDLSCERASLGISYRDEIYLCEELLWSGYIIYR
jgi:hypothetical protein